MPLMPAAAHLAWAVASAGAWRAFRAALQDPAAAQAAVLRRSLEGNAGTAFGRAHAFARIRTIAEFQRRVPISTYDDLEPFVGRVAAGEDGVLTREPVRRLQPSSGSTAAAKLIPYTRGLQREIARGVNAWIADLYRRRPGLMGGRAYWSITPAPPARDLPRAAIPVGFDDDSRYLGGLAATLARAVLLVPPAAGAAAFDLAGFRRTTLRTLLLARDLRLISVWHPSFLTALLDTLAADWDALVDDVARRDRRRARHLRARGPADVAGIWPRLQLVSCWADGPSAGPAAALAARLPGIDLQRKGLIATEAVVSVPFSDRRPLAVRSHFFEFVAPDGRPRLAHELEPDTDYVVVVTTGGGLYRYRLGDRVRVDGVVGSTPSITFVGRDDRVSDRFGEKLSDGFVAGVIDALFAGRTRPAFAMLAPERTADGVAYTLFVDRGAPLPAALATRVERELRRNPHYAWCVDLGQLQPARVAVVGAGAERAYLDACIARGGRLGDVKPVSLDARDDWRSVLPC
jgi:hypothetical protein